MSPVEATIAEIKTLASEATDDAPAAAILLALALGSLVADQTCPGSPDVAFAHVSAAIGAGCAQRMAELRAGQHPLREAVH